MTVGNRFGAWQNIVRSQKGICQLISSLPLKTAVLWQKKGNLVLGRRIAIKPTVEFVYFVFNWTISLFRDFYRREINYQRMEQHIQEVSTASHLNDHPQVRL